MERWIRTVVDRGSPRGSRSPGTPARGPGYGARRGASLTFTRRAPRSARGCIGRLSGAGPGRERGSKCAHDHGDCPSCPRGDERRPRPRLVVRAARWSRRTDVTVRSGHRHFPPAVAPGSPWSTARDSRDRRAGGTNGRGCTRLAEQACVGTPSPKATTGDRPRTPGGGGAAGRRTGGTGRDGVVGRRALRPCHMRACAW